MRFLSFFYTLLIYAAPAAGGFTDLWMFGDSLSDTGNGHFITQATGFSVPAAPSPPYHEERFSNGPIWVDVLAEGLGLPPAEASRRGGHNFAYGAAETGHGFLAFGGLSIPKVGAQIAEFEATGMAIADSDLVAVWAGANDLASGRAPSTIRANLADHLTTLHGLGARNFLLVNINGRLPRAGELNALIEDEVDGLGDSLDGVRFALLDFASLQEEILADLSAFGFSHGLGVSACRDCGSGVPSAIPVNIAADPDSYMLWDGVHPSAAYHALIGARALEVVATIPEPSPIALVAIIFGLLVLRRQIASP